MRREDVEALHAEGVDAVLAVIRRLEERIEELERRVNRDSGNSSMSPSSDSPKSRAERRRLAREAYRRSMRKTGAQPGHEGKTRELAPSERVDQRIAHPPERCECGYTFAGGEEQVGDPVIHQQYELPPLCPLVFEHERVRLACPCCGRAVLADLPGPALSGYGPRLEAHIAMLAGVFRLSREQVRQVVVEVFGIPASKGVIDATIMRVSRLCHDPWRQLRDAVRQAEAVHLDETSWRLAGATQWLWVAASALVACYRIDPHRSQAAAKALIGEDFGGFAITDRYCGYHFLDILQQQLCWCHVLRHLVEISERDGVTGVRGRKLVKLAREVIKAHHEYVQHNHQPAWLQGQLQPLRAKIKALLEECASGRHQRTARLASGLLEEYDALWTFADIPEAQLDPTNNRAEQAMRHPVLMRALQGGSQSEHGSRWVERIQSIRETCRLQKRPALEWLINATTAAHNGTPAPTLLPAPAAQSP